VEAILLSSPKEIVLLKDAEVKQTHLINIKLFSKKFKQKLH
jgi:hypothetical protein